MSHYYAVLLNKDYWTDEEGKSYWGNKKLGWKTNTQQAFFFTSKKDADQFVNNYKELDPNFFDHVNHEVFEFAIVTKATSTKFDKSFIASALNQYAINHGTESHLFFKVGVRSPKKEKAIKKLIFTGDKDHLFEAVY